MHDAAFDLKGDFRTPLVETGYGIIYNRKYFLNNTYENFFLLLGILIIMMHVIVFVLVSYLNCSQVFDD